LNGTGALSTGLFDRGAFPRKTSAERQKAKKRFFARASSMQTMAPTIPREAWTDEELESLPRDGYKYELLDGELLRNPGYACHGEVGARLCAILANFAKSRKLGEFYDAIIGFRLSADVVLSPDVSFVSQARLKKLRVAPEKFLAGAPDLVVEVLLPLERMTQISRKLELYFDHGTRLAWLINLRKQQVLIYTADSIEALTDLDDVLTGGAVLPGFKCKLRTIFLPG
jgi:Uma2 family endonuclease